MKDALSLADSVRSHTSKNKGDNNYKVINIIISYHLHIHQMLSPRFAPVLPDKYEGRGLLSPSVLAFYKVHIHSLFSFHSSIQDDGEDQIVPLPSLLESTGMERKDRDSLLEMIMEISGARETVEEASKV